MPEAAEVYNINREIDNRRNSLVTSVKVHSGRYVKRPIKNLDVLEGCTFSGSVAKGKLIVMCFTPSWSTEAPSIYALSTMGMTGYWGTRRGDEPPKHLRISIELKGGPPLDFCDARNFGTFKLASLKEVTRKMSELGFDLMYETPDPMRLIERLHRFGKNKTIAEVLLDQRVIAGVGNYIRADAMYLAGIDPRLPATGLMHQQLQDLTDACRRVAWCAARNQHPMVNGSASMDPSARMRLFENVCYGRQFDDEGNPIANYTDCHGRTVWWCPAKQAVTA